MTMNLEWECGLLRPEELTPLSQSLIPHELGCAFNIPPSFSAATCKAATPLSSDVLNSSQSAFDSMHYMRIFLPPSIELNRTCKKEAEGPTVQGTRDDVGKVMTTFIQPDNEIHQHAHLEVQGKAGPFWAGGVPPSSYEGQDQKSVLGHGQFPTSDRVSSFTVTLYGHIPKGPGVATSVSEVASGNGDLVHGVGPETTSLMQLTVDPCEEVDSGPSVERLQSASRALSNEGQSAARTLKKPRLVWTPQLHKRFVDAVAHLGIKNAVPKTIMQLMNVDGLTRENVASHLQKYRLYLKRIQGLSTEGPSSTDHLFASTPIPAGLAASTSNQTQQHVNLHSPSTLGGTVLHPILGNRARCAHVLPHLSLPTPSILKFDTRPALMPLVRGPTFTPITSTSECTSERYSQCGSSTPPGSILTLFPTSGSR